MDLERVLERKLNTRENADIGKRYIKNLTPETAEKVIEKLGLFDHEAFRKEGTLKDLSAPLAQYQYGGNCPDTKAFLSICSQRDVAVTVRGRWYAFVEEEGIRKICQIRPTHMKCIIKDDYKEGKIGPLVGAKLDRAIESFMKRILFAVLCHFAERRDEIVNQFRIVPLGESIQ